LHYLGLVSTCEWSIDPQIGRLDDSDGLLSLVLLELLLSLVLDEVEGQGGDDRSYDYECDDSYGPGRHPVVLIVLVAFIYNVAMQCNFIGLIFEENRILPQEWKSKDDLCLLINPRYKVSLLDQNLAEFRRLITIVIESKVSKIS